MKQQNFTTISVPKELADKIKARLEGTSFHSVSSYTTYVLRQVIANSQDENQEQTKVKKQLKILGYI